MKQAVGLIEVRGLASAVNVADTMVKVATVALLGIEKAKGNGWMTIKVLGDVGAVKASVDAGKSMSIENNSYISSLVIPRPAENLEKLFFNQSKKELKKSEPTIKEEPEKELKNEKKVEEVKTEVAVKKEKKKKTNGKANKQ